MDVKFGKKIAAVRSDPQHILKVPNSDVLVNRPGQKIQKSFIGKCICLAESWQREGTTEIFITNSTGYKLGKSV